MKVFVYYNMHRKTWSIKALEGVHKGRVVAHSNYVVVSKPVGQVSLKSRERVLLTGRKNVHAGIVGELQSIGLPLEVRGLMGDIKSITYDPYQWQSLVYKDTPERSYTKGADRAFMINKHVYVYFEEREAA